ncbi:MAG: Dihydrolipoyl dehydrogenase [Desulfovibrio sp.]
MSKTTIAVIGGGPGGYVAAIRAAQLGADVTLIEKEHIGGTCLNVGCIPTKALLHTATLYEEAKNGAACGVMAEVTLDFTKAQERKAAIVKKLVSGVGSLLKANGVKVVKGTASFDSAKTLRIAKEDGEEKLSFDKIIVAAGSVPAVPPIPGIDAKQCMDSTGALALESVPESMLIIGGGVIGIEIATLYATLGCAVQVVEMMDRILPMMDAELTRVVAKDLRKKGVAFFTGTKVLSVADTGGEAVVTVEDKDGRKELAAKTVLVSIGRRAATDSLNLDAAGITHERGKIAVNDAMETNVPGVYAIGDCNGIIMLAHIASDQGEIAAENAMGHAAAFNPASNPSCVYTNPEFAGVGLTEDEAKAKGVEFVVGKFPLAANGKALIMDGGGGVVKILAGKEHKEILGVHIVGPRATDLIAEAALAIGMEATVDEVIATIHAHPTLAEAFREAALAVEKRAIHIPNR